VLEVADTAIGIPADELPRVFDRFWRGQAAAHTSGSGTGLAIAAELAQAHSGTLTPPASRARGRASLSPCPAPERLHIAAMATAHRLHRRRLCLSHESKLRIHLQDDC
jgi:signal transduction histidine kinase